MAYAVIASSFTIISATNRITIRALQTPYVNTIISLKCYSPGAYPYVCQGVVSIAKTNILNVWNYGARGVSGDVRDTPIHQAAFGLGKAGPRETFYLD